MSQTAIIIGVVAYAAVAYIGALYLTYANEKESDDSLPPRLALVWPIVLALIIIAGPFHLANGLGVKARVKRMQDEHLAWLRDQDLPSS